ncbi:unnamed protein product [Paramecium pentaurelia]|uniref:Arrestin C-terminal-like domain-containing protein n=1 Tax=Paramecium pentaurelia TaxID=43138 RepID=A0A8S1YEB8_9CILI|nr:unnamed protein product [Paramecium pentaurelia]
MSKSILFQFNDAVTLAGEQITGCCYVRIPQDMPKVQIVLTFQTKEYSKVLEKKQIPYDESNPQMIPDKLIEKQMQVQITLDSPLKQPKYTQKKYELNGNLLYRVFRHYGTHESFIYTQELYNGSVKAGDYKFNFVIPTQFNMPSSFYYKSADGQKQGKCGYMITLKIDSTEEARTVMMESADVYLNSRFKESEQFRQLEGNIVHFLCLNSGAVELSVKLKTNKFFPGDKISVEYSVDNTRSQRPINRIEVRVINKLIFIDNDDVERIIEDQVVVSQNWDGLLAGQSKDRIVSLLELPKELKASLKTNTIKNQYYFQLEAIVDSFLTWLSVPVVCQIPIHIQEQQTKQSVNLDGWKLVSNLNVSVNEFSNVSVQQSYIP